MDPSPYEELKKHRDIRMRCWIGVVSLVLAFFIVCAFAIAVGSARSASAGLALVVAVVFIAVVVLVVVLWRRAVTAERRIAVTARPGAAIASVSGPGSSFEDIDVLGYEDGLPRWFTATLSDHGLELWRGRGTTPFVHVPWRRYREWHRASGASATD